MNNENGIIAKTVLEELIDSVVVVDFDGTILQANKEFERGFYQELSTFYVAITRAKRATYFSYSKLGLNLNGANRVNNPSCLLMLKGLNGPV